MGAPAASASRSAAARVARGPAGRAPGVNRVVLRSGQGQCDRGAGGEREQNRGGGGAAGPGGSGEGGKGGEGQVGRGGLAASWADRGVLQKLSEADERRHL